MAMIEVAGLAKSFGDTRAVTDISFTVPEGTVLGVLGPNGSGKTTTVRMLATLLRPDAGRIVINGVDAVANPAQVRTMIGLAGQYASVDERLTVKENLELIGRLAHLPRSQVRATVITMMTRFRLGDYRDRPAKDLSGGLRRRLDLAASLVADPAVVYLDEPTTGLDPGSRMDLWDVIRGIVAAGATIVLTTQYLEEADQLADRIVVIDAGRVIAEGTPDELKARIGGDVIEVQLAATNRDETARAAQVCAFAAIAEPRADPNSGRVWIPIASDTPEASGALLFDVLARLKSADIEVAEFALRHPSLDEVFLALTGHPQSRGDLS